MIFNSIAFAVFLPCVLVLYYILRHRWQNVWLLVASWFFYGWWDVRFLVLLGVSTVVDYCCAHGIAKAETSARRRMWLSASVLTNLTILGFFKYFNFFVGSAHALLQSLGLLTSLPTLNFILPMGISFYTFQTMAYTIDVYRKKMEPCRNFVSFALYVSYFPQLVAGPIERASRLIPQIEKPRTVSGRQMTEGAVLILIGLFKKVAVADALGPLVDSRFLEPSLHSGSDLLFCLYLFAIQIYCDFSGYSDIARGTSKLLGIELMVNFRQPYFAASITDFWRRWHISLSSWLRDYLYIPLGGNRGGSFRTYRNLMLTMLLGGLWHGASWAFVVWGGLHGLYLACHKLFSGVGSKESVEGGHRFRQILWHVICVISTFHLVCLTWIFFRAGSFETAWAYLTGILNWQSLTVIASISWLSPRVSVLLAALMLTDLATQGRGDEFIKRKPPVWRGVVYAALIVVALTLGGIDANIPFIYFQF